MTQPDHRQTDTTSFSLDDIFALARKKRALDVYLSAGSHPVIKGHGRFSQLAQLPVLTQADIERLVHAVMTAKQKKDVDRQYNLELMHRTKAAGSTRINLSATHDGMAAACRLLPARPPSFKEIGPEDALKKIATLDRGLILIAGESNSGKTTTMAAVVDHINTHLKKTIVTIENPVQFTHRSRSALVMQREIGVSAHDYNGSIHTAMRGDIDVLCLDGLDVERDTVDLMLDAAESHLVVATHRCFGGAGWQIRRIFNVFSDDQQDFVQTQLARVLRATIWQHLVPLKDGTDSKIAMEIMVSTEKIAALIRRNELHKIHAEIGADEEAGMQTIGDSIKKINEGSRLVETAFKLVELAGPLAALI
jgi:twitching motility protein PilT